MIYFILSKRNNHTIARFLRERGKSLRENIGVIHYEDLSPLQSLNCTVLVFSDLDIIHIEQLTTACTIYDKVRLEYPKLVIYNNPHQVKLRYGLLRSLYQNGTNPFNVYRVTEDLLKIRFPVFIRQESNHIGPLTSLINDVPDLQAHIISLEMQGWKRDTLLIVEYKDVKTPEGYFIRYAAMRIGDQLYPYLLDYDTDWVAKYIDSPLKDGQQYAEEYNEFVNQFEDQRLLMSIFEAANIDYGRIDYSYHNGKLVVWEINLNPDYEYGDYSHKHLDAGVRVLKKEMNEKIISNYNTLNSLESSIIELDIKSMGIGEGLKANDTTNFQKQRLRIINSLPIKKEILVLKRALFLILARLVVILKGSR